MPQVLSLLLFIVCALDVMASDTRQVGERLVLTPNIVSQITRLRQVCVTPALLGGKNDSGALRALRELVQSEVAVGRPCAVFTAFAEAISHIAAAETKSPRAISSPARCD